MQRREVEGNAANLFFLATELLFFETHTLGGEVLREDGIVGLIRVDSTGQFLCTIGLVQDIMGKGLEVGQVGAARYGLVCYPEQNEMKSHLSRAERNLEKSECFGLSTSTIPHG
jgi:hypothetical protein